MLNILETELRCTPYTLACMENGIRIDPAHFAVLTGEFDVEMQRINSQIDGIAGEHINPKSPPQVARLLHRLGVYPRPGMSTDGDTLAEYISRSPVVKMIIDYRHLKDMKTKYTEVLPRWAGSDGRIHTNIKTTTVVSGRWATEDPNLLAIPVRSAIGASIRRGFIPREGWMMLACDYSQLEIRIAAHMSQDAVMMSTLWAGGDIHSDTCMRMFGEVTKSKRYAAKRTGFGILYGISHKGLHDLFIGEGVTEFSESDCYDFIELWLRSYPGVANYIKEVEAFIRRNGWVADMFGRRRPVPEIWSVHEAIRAAGVRQGVNHTIQATAAGIIKQAMINLTKYLKPWYSFARPLLQIHDELLWEADSDHVIEVAEVIKQEMEGAVELRVPVVAEMKLGINWADKYELNLGE